jgi:hypothetical protein
VASEISRKKHNKPKIKLIIAMIKSIEMNNEKSTLNSTATKNEAIVRQTHKIA